MSPETIGTQPPRGDAASAQAPAAPPRPVRRRAVHEYRLGDELLVYVPNVETAYALNRAAVAVWELCDGTWTDEEISRELGWWLGSTSEALLPDVRTGIARFRELGLLETR